MVTFLISISVLVLGYFLYGGFISSNFGPDDRKTPAVENNDGIDYVPMPTWKVYLVQVLNIAGLGPIFGALNGALFGPVVYLWIVFGTILGGAVHDYMTGMMSMRNHGASVSELTGRYLGGGMLTLMRILSVILLVMTGVVFTVGPAGLLTILTPEKFGNVFWMCVIFAYYFIATFVPIDKVIGRIYPVFGIALIVMALGVGGSILIDSEYQKPELWNCFSNMHPSGTPVFPYMFITVACGAISGFHGTQSPIMARCCRTEKEGHIVFYGAMVTEGIIALVWAFAGVSFYGSAQALMNAGAGVNKVVYEICTTTMGKLGGAIAMLGVVACPISSGDTAYRSARLTLADWFGIDQSKWTKRLLLTAILLGAGLIISRFDYSVVWRYYACTNQILATITLWTAAVYLQRNGRNTLPCVLPSIFMTAMTTCYFFTAPECLGMLWNRLEMDESVYFPVSIAAGLVFAAVCTLLFMRHRNRTSGLSVH